MTYFRTHSSQLCELHGFLNLSEYTKKLNGCVLYLPSTIWPFDWDVCGHFIIRAMPRAQTDCFCRVISDVALEQCPLIESLGPILKPTVPFLCIFKRPGLR